MHHGDPYGCKSDTAEPLDERFPGRFLDLPGIDHTPPVHLYRCPWAELSSPDPWREAVVQLAVDHKAGVIRPNWRDYYTAAVVSAVDYVLGESGRVS